MRRVQSTLCQCGNPRRLVSGRLQAYCSECHNRYLREWRRLHPLDPIQRHKMNCRSYAHVYLKRGKLVRQPCEVPGCTNPSQMHHDDYDKPLEVRWLCAQHHRQWHRHYAAA